MLCRRKWTALWSSVRVPGYTTKMYSVSCEVRTEFIYVMEKKVDRLCGLVSEFLVTQRRCIVFPVRYELGHPLPGGYKYGDLALQVGWSLRWDSKIWPLVLRNFDPKVTALARTRSNCTLNYRPALSSESALQNNKPAIVWKKFRGERKIGRVSQIGAWHQDRLADWLSVAN
jgi:hypothetical protein